MARGYPDRGSALHRRLRRN